MIVFGLDKGQAEKKLSTIRAILGKKRHQLLLIAELCQAENIDRKIFEDELQRGYTALQNPK